MKIEGFIITSEFLLKLIQNRESTIGTLVHSCNISSMGGASEASAEKSYCQEVVILKSPVVNFFRSDAKCGVCDRDRSGNPGPAKAGRNCNEEPGFLDFL